MYVYQASNILYSCDLSFMFLEHVFVDPISSVFFFSPYRFCWGACMIGGDLEFGAIAYGIGLTECN